MLFVSSGAVYGKPSEGAMPITERTPLDPTTPYAQSKLAADLLAVQLAHERQLPIVVVRAFNHIGPRQQGEFAIAEFASQIARLEQKSDGELRCGRLDVARDFLDVRDVVRCYHALINRGQPGEVYNMASGTTRLLSDMLSHMLKRAQRTITVVSDPSRMRANDPTVISVDISKLRAATGWEPSIPIETTLDDTLDYYRQSFAAG
jgi:GDP-4-dehydro-6-deoxy-D-mannose reductase